MSTPRATRLAVSVSEVSLTASLLAAGGGSGQEPLFLLFSGAILAIAPDFRGDAWDMPTRLEGRTVTVRCISGPAIEKTAGDAVIGRCQFCPVACELDVAVEIDCCPKLFHVLKNTAGFGAGQTGAGITLMLDVLEADGQECAGDAVVRLDVTRLAVTASRPLHGSKSTIGAGSARPASIIHSVPVL